MLNLGLMRLAPAPLRPGLIAAVHAAEYGALMARTWARRRHLRRRSRPAFSGTKVAVIGFFRSRIGIGTAADLLARELEAAGATVIRIDAHAALAVDAHHEREGLAGLDALADAGLTDIIVHMNPPEAYKSLQLVPPDTVGRCCVVGYFAWELARVPDAWLPAVDAFDEIWVPSTFVRDAIEAARPPSAPRLLVRPHVVDTAEFRPPTAQERAVARASLGFGPSHFVVLTSFALTSTLARKNPAGAIAAFRAAFAAEAEEARFVLRVLHGERDPARLASLDDLARTDPRVSLVAVPRGDTSILEAYRAADVYLSLHRGEGFGLNIAEALAMEIPVVATAYSLNDAFLEHPSFHPVASRQIAVEDPQHLYDTVPGVTWAEPDVDGAAQALRALHAAWREGRPRP